MQQPVLRKPEQGAFASSKWVFFQEPRGGLQTSSHLALYESQYEKHSINGGAQSWGPCYVVGSAKKEIRSAHRARTRGGEKRLLRGGGAVVVY